MGILIAILNNISDWLVLKLSNKIINKLTLNLKEKGYSVDVNYRWNTSLELQLDLVIENQMSLDDELKIMGTVADINDKWPMISIQAINFTKEQYQFRS
jgi:hypothetical protein